MAIPFRAKLFRLILVLLLFTNLQFAENYKFNHLNMKHGLTQNAIYSIFQDSQGFMWFGTTNGLNRFDGYQFQTFYHEIDNPNSIKPGWINTITEDSEGNIWIGSLTHGISIYHPSTNIITHHSYEPNAPNTIPSNAILSFCRGKDGKIWIATKQGLSSYNSPKNKFKSYFSDIVDTQTLSSNYTTSCTVDLDGNIWIGTRFGLNRFIPEKDSFERFYMPQDFDKSNYIRKLFCDSNNNLWICTYEGLFKRDSKSGEIKTVYFNNSRLEGNYFWDVTEDDQGDIWFSVSGEVHGGLYCLDPGTGNLNQFKKQPSNPDSLSDNQILRLFKDQSGLLWAGTWTKGLNYFNPNQKIEHFYHNKDPFSLSKNEIYSICEDHQNQLWMASFDGVINKFNPITQKFQNILKHPIKTDPFYALKFLSIFHDKKDTLWIGHRINGFSRYHIPTKTWTHHKPQPNKPGHLNSVQTLSFFQDSHNHIWVGTVRGLNLWNPKDDNFVSFICDPADPSTLGGFLITDFHEDSQGFIWVATNNGVSRMDQNYKIKRYLNNEEVRMAVTSICPGPEPFLWLGTKYLGLIKFNTNSGEYKSFKPVKGMIGNQIRSIIPHKDSLWISSNNGLVKFNTLAKTFHSFKKKDGVAILEFTQAALKSNNGKIYFGGHNGLIGFHPDSITESKFNPPIVISSLKVFPRNFIFSNISKLESITISYKDTTLFFEFASLDFKNPSGNSFSYKLEPLLENWIDLGTKHDLTLSNLRPGKYHLKIRGTNSDGIWNQKGIGLKINISPPFWGTMWFKTFMILLFGLLILFWHKHRMKKQEIKLRSEANADKFCQRYKITAREREIIELVLQGKTNNEMEEILFISSGTVKNHIYNIFKKLNIKNRTQLANLLSDWKKPEDTL